MITLDKGKLKKEYKIEKFLDHSTIVRRFLELGLTVGQKVKVVATSLQKKVFLIEVRGYLLSIRTSLLEKVVVSQ
ncbi:MAG: ferrous iron transport protein A [Clostridiales bacterium]|nr:ferrous iron transport protein A [Clostridiales bacterium]